MIPEHDLPHYIKGRKKNPRVGCRPPASDLAVYVGFRSLSEDDRAAIVRWYRSGYFTQEELSKIFHTSISIVNKAVRAFAVEAKEKRGRLKHAN